MFWISRVPRTLAVVLAGTAVAVAGLIMQLMVRNRFVEPSTVGTVESATLGILVVTVALPAAPIMLKMGVAGVFAARRHRTLPGGAGPAAGRATPCWCPSWASCSAGSSAR